MSRICLTLAEKDLSLLEEKLRRYSGTTGFVELRIDVLDDPERFPAPPSSVTHFIATCRPTREGGFFEGDEGVRLEILRRAAAAGFHWIDLEHDVPVGPDWAKPARMLRSAHDFSGFPQDLESAFGRIAALPGDGVKLAVNVAGTADLVSMLKFLEAPGTRLPRVILGMGPAGMVTRILGPLLGAAWTYVVESADRSVAPGQFSFSEARDLFRIDHWQEVPNLWGVALPGSGGPPDVAEANRRLRDAGVGALAVPLVLDSIERWLDYVSTSRLPWKGFLFDRPVAAADARRLGISGEALFDVLFRGHGGWRAEKAGDRRFQLLTEVAGRPPEA